MQLLYLKNHQIDKALWDASLANSTNNLIYAQSNYLQLMCKDWYAIVSPNYEYIMPLPIGKKYGITYIPNVAFVQQLGIYSALPITNEIMNLFQIFLQTKIKLADYNFNYSNTTEAATLKNNYILNLNTTYENLYSSYKNDVKKDLKNIEKHGLIFIEDYDFVKAIQFFKTEIGGRIKQVTEKDYNNFRQLCQYYVSMHKLSCKAVVAHNEVVATAIFIIDNNRIYNIASSINATGKKVKANHYLYNNLIQAYANTNTILDFEGSDIPGIANYYKQFGATNVPYSNWQYNNLSRFVKWFKN